MAKFGVGDTVVGNALNCNGVTCEDCEITVTKVGPHTFAGIIDSHPDDGDYEGETHEGLRYDWFDLVESASDIINDSADWDDDWDWDWKEPVTKRAIEPTPTTVREEDSPKDVKTWGRRTEQIIVQPAHGSVNKEVVPIKTHYVPTPSFEGAFDVRKARKKGHIRLKTD